MVSPSVLTTKLTGGLGISPGSAGKMLAVIGTSDGYGTALANIPIALSRAADVLTNFGNAGPLIRSMTYATANYGKSVLGCYVTATTAGSLNADGYGYAGSGTGLAGSSFTANGVNDTYEPRILVVTGGTVGTAGIVIQYSLDNGRTYSANQSLGTVTTFAIPKTGVKGGSGIVASFGAGTMVAGDTFYAATTGPQVTAADIATALTNFQNSAQPFEVLLLASPLESAGTILAALDAWVANCVKNGNPKMWIANTTIPTTSQTDSAYQTALAPYAAHPSANAGSLCAGAAQIASNVPNMGYNYIDPISYAVAPLLVSVSEEQSIADLDIGQLPGVNITDLNGNPAARCHNELLNPGLDALNFLTLRTWTSVAGVYVNMPRLFSVAGSDFDNQPKLRVWNLAQAGLFAFFMRRLQKPILVNPKTGFILESTAQQLEKAANQVLTQILLGKPKASFTEVAISRTDQLLNTTTPTITVDARIIPLAYPVYINLNLGFEVTVTSSF